ncbi:MAG TPA: Clp protease N-terminal domain-containing protein [Acidimicrobiales bacterium]|nr:Clp protease N-terminal domain-containing protein [Acidimicrobiales bacterium]
MRRACSVIAISAQELVLLGLIHEGDGVAAHALARLGIMLGDVRRKVGERTGSTTVAHEGAPPFSGRLGAQLASKLRG